MGIGALQFQQQRWVYPFCLKITTPILSFLNFFFFHLSAGQWCATLFNGSVANLLQLFFLHF
jgi:hypothetical protein